MTSSEKAGYQSEAQEVTGRGSAFPHNTCAVRKGSGYPRRGSEIPSGIRRAHHAPKPTHIRAQWGDTKSYIF